VGTLTGLNLRISTHARPVSHPGFGAVLDEALDRGGDRVLPGLFLGALADD
jgi:hypothetical protein